MASRYRKTQRLITWRCTVIDMACHRHRVSITALNLNGVYTALDTSYPERRAEFLIRQTPKF